MSQHSIPTRDFILGRVKKLLEEILALDPSAIREDSTIDGELEMHSVAFVELQVAIEEELDIQLDPIVIVELNRLGDIIDYIFECARESRA